MLTPEEGKVLAYLRRRRWATVADLSTACLPGTPPEWVGRILWGLEWLGLVASYPGAGGTAAALQITARGMEAAGGPSRHPADAASGGRRLS